MKYFIDYELKKRFSIIILLTVCLWLLAFSYVYASRNIGIYKLNLNNGQPVVDVSDGTFAPGMKLSRNFFIENISDEVVDFRLYFTNINGKLKDILLFKIKDGDNIIAEGKMTDFTKRSSTRRMGTLNAHEKKFYLIEFYFPTNVNNDYKKANIEFDLQAIGVWANDS